MYTLGGFVWSDLVLVLGRRSDFINILREDLIISSLLSNIVLVVVRLKFSNLLNKFGNLAGIRTDALSPLIEAQFIALAKCLSIISTFQRVSCRSNLQVSSKNLFFPENPQNIPFTIPNNNETQSNTHRTTEWMNKMK